MEEALELVLGQMFTTTEKLKNTSEFHYLFEVATVSEVKRWRWYWLFISICQTLSLARFYNAVVREAAGPRGRQNGVLEYGITTSQKSKCFERKKRRSYNSAFCLFYGGSVFQDENWVLSKPCFSINRQKERRSFLAIRAALEIFPSVFTRMRVR